MPIKVIDTIVPANTKFKVVDAENISYNGSTLSTRLNDFSSDLEQFRSIVTGEPRFADINTTEYKLKLNSDQIINFTINTQATGMCTINV